MPPQPIRYDTDFVQTLVLVCKTPQSCIAKNIDVGTQQH